MKRGEQVRLTRSYGAFSAGTMFNVADTYTSTDGIELAACEAAYKFGNEKHRRRVDLPISLLDYLRPRSGTAPQLNSKERRRRIKQGMKDAKGE